MITPPRMDAAGQLLRIAALRDLQRTIPHDVAAITAARGAMAAHVGEASLSDVIARHGSTALMPLQDATNRAAFMYGRTGAVRHLVPEASHAWTSATTLLSQLGTNPSTATRQLLETLDQATHHLHVVDSAITSRLAQLTNVG